MSDTKEGFGAKRMRGLNLIINSLEAIDQYNLKGEDAKLLDFDKLVIEVMTEFQLKEETARIWCNEAKKMHENKHANNQHYEYLKRNVE